MGIRTILKQVALAATLALPLSVNADVLPTFKVVDNVGILQVPGVVYQGLVYKTIIKLKADNTYTVEATDVVWCGFSPYDPSTAELCDAAK